jgi:hypothetical protein
VESIEDDLAEDEEPLGIEDEIAVVPAWDAEKIFKEALTRNLHDHLPEVIHCDCPRADDNVHERDCVHHPDYQAEDCRCPATHHHLDCPQRPKPDGTRPAPQPSVEDEWKANPYSLPPATREGVECPACRDASKRAWGLTAVVPTVRHVDQETVDECMRRQRSLGWIDSTGRPDLR